MSNKQANIISISILCFGLLMFGVFYVINVGKEREQSENAITFTQSNNDNIDKSNTNPYESLFIKHQREANNPYASLYQKYQYNTAYKYNDAYSSLYNFLKVAETPNSAYASLYRTSSGSILN